MKTNLLLLLSLISFGDSHIEQANLTQCLRHLEKYFKTELKVHQIMLFVESNKNITNEKILSTFIENSPVLLVNFDNATKKIWQNSKNLKLIKNPESTTLFIVPVYIEDLNYAEKFTPLIDLIISAAYNKGNPNCLFLFFSKQRNLRFEQFLKTMWNNRFLDATILHIATVNEERNVFLSNEQVFATIHQFNPYFEKYTEEICLHRTELFPGKLRDLNGYGIKYGTYNQPLQTLVELNSTGYPVVMKGRSISFANLLSRVMNFKLVFFPSKEKSFGRYNCFDRSAASGYMYNLANNEIQIMAVNLITIPVCLYSSVNYGRQDLTVLVPILMEYDDGIEGKFLLYMTGAMSILAVISVWLFIRVLKFDRHYWKLMYIIQIVIQMSTPQEPIVSRERLIFCYLLIVSTAYSSNLFGALTGIEFSKERELRFDTIKDVYDSFLQPVGLLGLSTQRLAFEEGTKRNYVDKHLEYLDFIDICIRDIVKYKNISCTMQVNEAAVLIENTKDMNGKAQLKVVKEPLLQSSIGVYLETNSLYSRRFQHILQIATQAGLVMKWEKEDLNTFSNSSPNDSFNEIYVIGGKKLLLLLFGIGVIGFSLSFVVFIMEFLVLKFFNSRNRHTGQLFY